jgi:hypothetical protein
MNSLKQHLPISAELLRVFLTPTRFRRTLTSAPSRNTMTAERTGKTIKEYLQNSILQVPSLPPPGLNNCTCFKIFYLFCFCRGDIQVYCILHWTENPIYVFPEMKLRGLVPNSYIHLSVGDLQYIFPGSVCLFKDRTL